MKPRFSILTVLAFTFWVALTCAACVAPTSDWSFAVYGSWCLVLLALVVLAAQRDSYRTAFFRGWLFATIVYAVAMASEVPWQSVELRMPHDYLAQRLQRPIQPPSPDWSATFADIVPWSDLQLQNVAFCNVSLAFGLLGGCLAPWRYRVLERRAKQSTAPVPSGTDAAPT